MYLSHISTYQLIQHRDTLLEARPSLLSTSLSLGECRSKRGLIPYPGSHSQLPYRIQRLRFVTQSLERANDYYLSLHVLEWRLRNHLRIISQESCPPFFWPPQGFVTTFEPGPCQPQRL